MHEDVSAEYLSTLVRRHTAGDRYRQSTQPTARVSKSNQGYTKVQASMRSPTIETMLPKIQASHHPIK